MGIFKDLLQHYQIGTPPPSNTSLESTVMELQDRVNSLEAVVGELLRELDEGIEIDMDGNVNAPLSPRQ